VNLPVLIARLHHAYLTIIAPGAGIRYAGDW